MYKDIIEKLNTYSGLLDIKSDRDLNIDVIKKYYDLLTSIEYEGKGSLALLYESKKIELIGEFPTEKRREAQTDLLSIFSNIYFINLYAGVNDRIITVKNFKMTFTDTETRENLNLKKDYLNKLDKIEIDATLLNQIKYFNTEVVNYLKGLRNHSADSNKEFGLCSDNIIIYSDSMVMYENSREKRYPILPATVRILKFLYERNKFTGNKQQGFTKEQIVKNSAVNVKLKTLNSSLTEIRKISRIIGIEILREEGIDSKKVKYRLNEDLVN